MKRVVCPSGHFDCEFIQEESKLDCIPNPYWQRIARPNFQLIKKSDCIVRFEQEPGDISTLQKLTQELKTPFDVANHLATKEEAKISQERLHYFKNLLSKAQEGKIEEFEVMQYIETSDSYTLHGHAKYRYTGDVIEQEFPCKIGEPLIYTLNPQTLHWELKS